MGALEEIAAIDIKAMGVDETRDVLGRHLKRVLLPLSLMDLQCYEPLPRDWDILDAIAAKAEDAEAHHKADVLDEAGYIKLGNMHYVREEFDKALDRYSRAAAMHGSPKALKNKGIALINLSGTTRRATPSRNPSTPTRRTLRHGSSWPSVGSTQAVTGTRTRMR
jgi:hypothetical protein